MRKIRKKKKRNKVSSVQNNNIKPIEDNVANSKEDIINYYWKLIQIEERRWKDVQDKANSFITVLGFLLAGFSLILGLGTELKKFLNLLIAGFSLIIISITIHIALIIPKKKMTLPFEREKIAKIILNRDKLIGTYQSMTYSTQKINDISFYLIILMGMITFSVVIIFTILFFSIVLS